MIVKKNHSLKKLNTFGLEARAEQFIEIHSVEELLHLQKTNLHDFRIIGGGSNLLLTSDLPGIVLKNEIKGIRIVEEDDEHALIESGGGVVWHELVLWAIDRNLGGIENLSLIPGSVGAAPIQNIGAYGVELQDVFHHLEAVHLQSWESHRFSSEECQFGYRDSIFKNKKKNQYFITKVFLILSKKPTLNTSYGAIREVLEQEGVENPTIRDVSNAVISIRQSKLPDPKEIGNSGSFFKNPEVDLDKIAALKSRFEDLVFYDLPNGMAKVPAGWLIEKAGWKGKRFGDAGCHEKQALVLVNYGSAKGAEIQDLASKIQSSVLEIFEIELSPEVNIW